MTAPKLTQTAPERIWLQVNPDDRDDCHHPFPYGSEVTWCSDSVGGAEVAYVRKDLADAIQNEIGILRKRRNEVDDEAFEYAEQIERLREALKGLLICPQMADAELLGPWGCPDSAAAEAKARKALAATEDEKTWHSKKY